MSLETNIFTEAQVRGIIQLAEGVLARRERDLVDEIHCVQSARHCFDAAARRLAGGELLRVGVEAVKVGVEPSGVAVKLYSVVQKGGQPPSAPPSPHELFGIPPSSRIEVSGGFWQTYPPSPEEEKTHDIYTFIFMKKMAYDGQAEPVAEG